MIQVTTQCRIRTAVHPMTRQLWVDHLHLHQHHLRGTWFTDTLLSKVQSKLGNTCANIYMQGKFAHAIPMTLQKDAGKSLIEFTDDVNIPEWLIIDGLLSLLGGTWNLTKRLKGCVSYCTLWSKDEKTRIMLLGVKSEFSLRDGSYGWQRRMFLSNVGILGSSTRVNYSAR